MNGAGKDQVLSLFKTTLEDRHSYEKLDKVSLYGILLWWCNIIQEKCFPLSRLACNSRHSAPLLGPYS